MSNNHTVNLAVMKQNLRFALLGAVIGLTGSVLGMQALSVTPFGIAETSTTMESGSMLGHITLTATDANGNIKSYIQTDNRVVDQGEACALKAVFRETAGGSLVDCTGAAVDNFDVVALGTGVTADDNNDVQLATETFVAGLSRAVAGTVSVADDTSGSLGAIATISRIFTNAAGGTVTISESGIFNATSNSTDGMFARQIFTGIPVANGDSLTVTWTITFDGA